MGVRKVEGVYYTKFNNHDKRSTMIISNKKGTAVVDHPFSDSLEQKKLDNATNTNSVATNNTTTSPDDEEFIWGFVFERK